MTKKRKDALIPAIITAITVLATVIVLTTWTWQNSVEAQGSDAVHVITGKATVNGAPARIGAIVTAYLDGRMVISSTVTGAQGEFRPLTVTGPGGEVSFKIDGDIAGELVEWSDGATTIQDLSVGSDQAAGTDPGSMPGQGPPGRQGKTGPQGRRGVQGDTGPRGETGKRGEEGQQGNRGVRGPRGYPGTDGAEGPPGPEAADGLNGMDGFHGSEGPTGPTGSSAKGLAVLSLIMSFLTLSVMGGLVYLMWKQGMLKGIPGITAKESPKSQDKPKEELP